MSTLQEQIFSKSKHLIKRFSIVRFFFYFGITVALTLVIFYFAELLDPYTIGIVLFLAVIYSLLRDFIIARFSYKLMNQFYLHLLRKEPNIDLYIPVLEKNFQGYFFKKQQSILRMTKCI